MAQSACQGMRVVTVKEAVQSMIVRPQTTRDIGEQLSEIHSRDETTGSCY